MNIYLAKSINFLKKVLINLSIIKISFFLFVTPKSIANEKKSATPAEILSRRADNRYKGGDFDGAYSDYQKVLTFDSNNFNAYSKMAALDLKKYNYVNAVFNYKNALANKSSFTFPEKKFILGILKYEEKEYKESEILIKEFLTEQKKSLFFNNAKTYQGLLNFHLKNYKKAIEILKPQLTLNPYSLSKYYCPSKDCKEIVGKTIGKSFYFLKDYRNAIAFFEPAIAISKKYNYKDNYYLGVSYFKFENYELANFNLNKVIDLSPKSDFASSAYGYKGIISFNGKDYKNAINYFDKALKLNPKDDGTFNNRGVAKDKLGNFEGAIEDYTISISLDKREPKGFIRYGNRILSYIALGDKQKMQGKVEDSKLSFKKACEDYYIYKNLGGSKYKIRRLVRDICQNY